MKVSEKTRTFSCGRDCMLLEIFNARFHTSLYTSEFYRTVIRS